MGFAPHLSPVFFTIYLEIGERGKEKKLVSEKITPRHLSNSFSSSHSQERHNTPKKIGKNSSFHNDNNQTNLGSTTNNLQNFSQVSIDNFK